MKAKEYIKKYKEDIELLVQNDDTSLFANKLSEILNEFTSEIKIIIEFRNTESTQSLIGVLNELDNKWQSVSSKIKPLSKLGFRKYIYLVMPEMADIMKWDSTSLKIN